MPQARSRPRRGTQQVERRRVSSNSTVFTLAVTLVISGFRPATTAQQREGMGPEAMAIDGTKTEVSVPFNVVE